jgi:hypothetical protein
MRFSKNYGVQNLAESFYDEGSTSASFTELLNFIRWCKKNLDTEPFIIGGWAVYAYTKKQKSLDIDVVFSKKQEMEKAMNSYYRENGFEKEELFDQQKHFFKVIDAKSRKIEVRFDAFCFADKNALVENSGVEIPWKLLEKNNSTMPINGLNAKMPNSELLLIFKVKALRDRMAFIDARGIRIDAATRTRTKAKILKDEQDIRDILQDAKINSGKLEAILDQTKFKDYFNNTMRTVAPDWKD